MKCIKRENYQKRIYTNVIIIKELFIESFGNIKKLKSIY